MITSKNPRAQKGRDFDPVYLGNGWEKEPAEWTAATTYDPKTSKVFILSQGRLKLQTQDISPVDRQRILAGKHEVGQGDSRRMTKNTQEQVKAAEKELETRKQQNPLTAYDRTLLEYLDTLKASSYQLSPEQLDALMGTGGKLPQRQEELTLTIGSRSARRVTPQSNSLTLGVRS